MSVHLPVYDELDRVAIANPCTVPWASMKGSGPVRHCGSCVQNVYDVAGMRRDEVLALLSREQPVCLRIYRRPDGTVTTADCWSRLRAARRRGWWPFVGMLFVVGWAFVAAAAVGLLGLKNLTGGRRMGEVRPVAIESIESPVPEVTPSSALPEEPLMGKPVMPLHGRVRTTPNPEKKKEKANAHGAHGGKDGRGKASQKADGIELTEELGGSF